MEELTVEDVPHLECVLGVVHLIAAYHRSCLSIHGYIVG
jgi:hypothetical protein